MQHKRPCIICFLWNFTAQHLLLFLSNEDVDTCTDNSLLEVHANRDQLENANVLQFATKYTIVNNKLVSLANNTVPRIFSNFSHNLKGPNFSLYQLLRYKPWKETQDNAWGNQEATYDILINTWMRFLQATYAQTHVPDWFEKLEL